LRKSASWVRRSAKEFFRFVDLDPAYPLALDSRGECELHLNDLGAARQDYNKALELDPVSAISLQGLGLVALQARDAKTALAYFNRALQLNVHPRDHHGRGHSHGEAQNRRGSA
jgi:tetratricopeptide (TPR) repeat protein